MGDLPKWVTDALGQMPVVVGMMVAASGVAWWCKQSHARELDRADRSHARELRLTEQKWRAKVRVKADRIRELERRLRRRRGGGR